jgi:uncharacterized protein
MKNTPFSLLQVKVIPKASENKIVGWEGDHLKIKIHAVPEKGAVNELLCKFLAKTLEIPLSHVTLLKGKTSRLKTVKIGLAPEALAEKIENNKEDRSGKKGAK